MKTKKLRLKVMSCTMALIVLLNVFPAVALDNATIEETPATTKNIAAQPKTSTEEVYTLPEKYQDYILENIPTELKERINIGDTAVGLDTTDAENPDSLTVVNSDGTKTLTVFSEPIKYIEEETDKVQFISDELTVPQSGENAYQCTTNSQKLYFPKDITKGVLLTHGEYSVTMVPALVETKKNGKIKIKKVKLKKQDYAQYEGVFGENTLIQYAPTPTGLKENIVLNSYNGVSEFSYIIDAKGLVPDVTEGAEINFTNPETGEAVFKIEPTFVYDARYTENPTAKNSITYNNYYKVEEQKNGKYLFTTVVDKAFLESESTVYPVVVDPMIESAVVVDSIETTNFLSFNFVGNKNNLILGGELDGLAYIKVNRSAMAETSYISANRVTKATFHAYCADGSESINLSAYNYLGSTGSLNHPKLKEPDFLEYVSTAKFGTTEDNKINITSLVKEWMRHSIGEYGYSNNGFVLASSSSNSSLYTVLGSGENDQHALRPYIQINYYDDDSIQPNVYVIKNNFGKYLHRTAENDLVLRDSVSESCAWQVTNYSSNENIKGIYVLSSFSDLDMKICYNDQDDDIKVMAYTGAEHTEPEKYRWRIVRNSNGTYRIMNVNQHTIAINNNILFGINLATYHEYRIFAKWYLEPYTPNANNFEANERTTSQWPTQIAQSNANILKGLTPRSMEYKVDASIVTTGSGSPYAYVDQTVTNGAAMTDGSITGSNVDIRSYTLTELGTGKYMRYIDRKDGCRYREKGELYLDIAYDLGSITDFNTLWFATNTLNNYYKVGAFEIYVSNTPGNLFYGTSKRAEFDKCNEMWSGVASISFEDTIEAQYIGIRITQGVLQKPESNPWTASEAEHAYARIRDIAVFNVDYKKLTIENYYDNGMLERWNTNDADLTGEIGIPIMELVAQQFFEQLEYNGENLGIQISFENIEKYQSTADLCSTANNAADRCTCNGIDHKAEQTILAEFATQHKYNPVVRMVPTLWTGHVATNDYGEPVYDGAATYSHYGKHVIMLNTGGAQIENLTLADFVQSGRIQSTYIHELCHVFGAVDSYCFENYDEYGMCSNENCVACNEITPYDENCLMSGWYPDNIGNYDYNDLLCNKCKEDIYNFIYGG